MATSRVPGTTFSATPDFPRYVDVMFLGAAGAETWTVPSGTKWVIISPNAAVYARTGGTAVVPTDEVADGTGSFYIAAGAALQVRVGETQTISFIRVSGDTIVTIGCWDG